jgi:dTDP-glucose 4,6-dehydratase
MRVLVTGGCGFTGSNFIRYLLQQADEYQVVNLDALIYAGNPANLDAGYQAYDQRQYGQG